MSGFAKSVSADLAESNDHLGFTEEEAFQYLETVFGGEQMQPGDLTNAMIAKRYGIADETARTKMAKLVEQGIFSRIRVNDKGKFVYIYRRVIAAETPG